MRTAILTLLLAIAPIQALALDTSEALGLVAMPLAVAAVSQATGVPTAELGQVVAALNRANVPPTEVIQIIRYVPVALVVEEERPQFVQFVNTQVDQGVTGPRLVEVIDHRLRTYDVTPQVVRLTQPATTYVVSDGYVPPAVITRVTDLRTTPLVTDLDTSDLLALIALPLAVDAAAGMSGVDRTELIQLVSMLNAAGLEPLRMVDVIQTAPVALVNDPDAQFIQLLRTDLDRGVRGDALVTVIDERLRTYDRTHPHGGPPGQLKKAAGVQTGAEIVHGEHPGNRGRVRARDAQAAPVTRVAPQRERTRPEVRNEKPNRPRGKAVGQRNAQPNQGAANRANKPDKVKNQGKGQGKGQSQGKGKP